MPNGDVLATLFDVVSATSNAGLTSGIMNAEFHVAGKYIFMALMWLGHLEIIPALILILSLLLPRQKESLMTNPV